MLAATCVSTVWGTLLVDRAAMPLRRKGREGGAAPYRSVATDGAGTWQKTVWERPAPCAADHDPGRAVWQVAGGAARRRGARYDPI
jgi:hypothetical protein